MIFVVDEALVAGHAIAYISAMLTFANEDYLFVVLLTRFKVVIN
jgi:hypothetical protein